MTPSHPLSSRMDTMEIAPATISKIWSRPPWQRAIRNHHPKVLSLKDQLVGNGGVIDGVITLGTVKKDPNIYVVDGQHRLYAAGLSGLPLVYADVRFCEFESMSSMAQEFVRLNSSIVKMRPDDVLRGCEPTLPNLKRIREACDFVGYDIVRRGPTETPILGMSRLLRWWIAGGNPSPALSGAYGSAQMIAENLTEDETSNLIVFLLIAFKAWGRDKEYLRLWQALNLTLCMWLYHNLVMDKERKGAKRHLVLDATEFRACLIGLAQEDYMDWIKGKQCTDLHRGPCYNRIKALWTRTLHQRGFKDKIAFPTFG